MFQLGNDTGWEERALDDAIRQLTCYLCSSDGDTEDDHHCEIDSISTDSKTEFETGETDV